MVIDENKLKELADIGKYLKILILEDNKMVQKILDVLLGPYFKTLNIINNAQDAISHYEATSYDIVLINIEATSVKDTLAWEAINSKNTLVIVYAINKDNEELERLRQLGVETCAVDSIRDDVAPLYEKLYNEGKKIYEAKVQKELSKHIIDDKVYDFETNCDMEEISNILDDIDIVYNELAVGHVHPENMISVYNILIRLYNSLSTFTHNELQDKLQSFTELVFDIADFMLFINLDILNDRDNNSFKVFEQVIENVIKALELGFKKSDLAEIKGQEVQIKTNIDALKKELGIL